MISVEEALEKIIIYVNILEEEPVPILDTLGQVLAEDISSSIDIPPLDNAAMDGYAIQAGDTASASRDSPSYLHVIDTVVAGAISEWEVRPGTATRIMTGAPVPKGADSVVRFEDTDETQREKSTNNEIGILCTIKTGTNIRRAGEDVTRESLVLKKGTVIRPAEVGVLASLGKSQVKVIRRPVVAILATGNELVEIDQPLPAGKIYNSNTYSVAALVQRYGGIPKLLGIALDSEASLIAGLRQGLDADMLITSGGVSAGDYDIVKDILAKEGKISFWTVRMKPGKPLAFGTIKGTDKKGATRNLPHLGLPGNPVSSMVTFELFARPAIHKMMGKKSLAKPMVEAIIEDPVINTDERRVYTRAIVTRRGDKYYARLTGPQGSGILTSMSLANGLVVVPEDRTEIKAGETAQVIMLDWNGEFYNLAAG
ncbi:MAG: molybdopterin molybdenumtransferase MoeA [Dehalococcoidales bacterium]|jgi:molybdopterin molybdotransferase|nr:molybdopterin molybdenumtransferase MoeA [Dehalococcoidales bacterium]MDP6448658.1 molybdopterin molybdotransferase MoeA [Dehalococcoidales bacterium]MDP6577260.1 molybdopterin molybdotransferase MoeA [Dehalococcoidales bacterium]|tara:strand:+ start:816 stop:2096 length:1281 start_codon:yes stop_codon:yes gene_type:complete